MGLINYIKKHNHKKYIKEVKKGNNVSINIGTILKNPHNITIGSNTYINGGYLFAGEKSKIIIGEDCLISYNVHIRTTTHNYKKKSIKIREQGNIEKDIKIEDDVWIGFGAQIMPGVTLHTGCVIGAGAVVTKDVDEYTVVAGVPARKISERKD